VRAASAEWLRFLATYLRPFRGRFALLAVLLLGGIGLELLAPQLVRVFIDGATRHAAVGWLLGVALLALGAAVINQFTGAGATYFGQDVGWAATNLLREDLALHLLRQDMRYHNTHTPGELIERIDGDLSQLSTFFSILLIQVVGSAGLLLGTLALLFLADWRIGLALLLFVGVAFVVLARMRTVAVPAGIQEREVSATFLGFLEERLAGVEDIRANGGGAYVMDRFYLAMRRWFRDSVNAWTRRASLWTVTTLLFSLGMALTLGLSAYLYVVAHAITLGTVYLFFQYTVLLQGPVEQISQQMQEFQKAASSLIRVRKLLALTPEDEGGDLRIHNEDTEERRQDRGFNRRERGGRGEGRREDLTTENTEDTEERRGGRRSESRGRLGQREGRERALAAGVGIRRGGVLKGAGNQLGAAMGLAVEFDHVTFAYDDDEETVLHDVDFALPAGQVLGLLGRTGSGKTTMSRLLFRLYDATEGAVRLNGVDVRELPLADLRRRVGLVTQDVQLFQATVRENLTFFDPRVEDTRIHAVIAEMGLEDWLARLPAGLDTHLEAGGGGLSAGEAQLLAFIRVFLRDPGLVILDEPSSRLDLATERLIDQGVGALLRGRTGIIIAHRLGTVQRADRIMTLGDGRVLEYGAREELARAETSRFHELLRAGMEEVLV
jgi:ABC-type multidrug transport system fused ATPase/permease subunit